MAQTSIQPFRHLQDVMGTIPMVKRYIVLSLIFSIDPSTSISTIESALQDASARLVEAFPFLAGQVIFERRDESSKNTGIPLIIPLSDSIQIITKDLRSEVFPTFVEMHKAKLPFSMLDPAILAPSIASTYVSDNYGQTAPVLILQANYITGGLILTVSGNHTQMDMTGMGILISLLSKALRKESFTPDEVYQINQPRANAVPLLDSNYIPGPEIDDVIAKAPTQTTVKTLSSNPSWAYFHFSPSSLSTLKSRASNQSITPYISTDDAIAALCWQHLTACRPHLAPDDTTTFARPLSVRKWLNLHNYVGHMADVVYTALPSIPSTPLGEIAGHLRQALTQDESITFHARAYATLISRTTNRAQFINGANLDPDRDVVLSSYANIRCCELVFGVLGRPVAARRPRMGVAPGLCYLMPKDADGGICVAVCVGAEDLARLKKDEGWREFAEFVG